MRNRIIQFFMLTGFSAMLACEQKPAETTATAASSDGIDRTVLPIKQPPRQRFSELDVRNTTPPPRFEVHAPKDAPNVVVILLDDMGFAVPETFGGPAHMPTLDRLAKNGLTYNRFHTTALCTPTRAALLTGYNSHSVNLGIITELATTYPGYTSIRPQSITPMAEVLRQNGYSTAQFGKSHETPTWEKSSNGPQDRWPTHSGFEKFYGFLGGITNNWAPLIYDGVTMIETPNYPGYHFTNDMTNQAVSWVQKQQALQPDKPFFIYYAPGATRAPHHAPKEYSEKYKGKFDKGWDVLREETLERQKKLGIVPANTVLPPKPKEIPDWDSHSPLEKKLFARQMEVFAGFAEHTDHEIGRLIEAIEEMGELDNTIIFFIAGDNGSSAEGQQTGMFNEWTYFNRVKENVEDMMKLYDEWGTESTNPHMAAGWAVATNTPFTWTKQMASDFGGTRNGLVIHWPKGIKAKGEIRNQFGFVSDIAPTVYEVTGIPAPKMVNGIEQDPIEGTSLAYSFDKADAPEQHTVQYFEIGGNRAIYQDGWYARTIHLAPYLPEPYNSLQNDVWELYNTKEDFSLSNDLSKNDPERLKAMQDLFMNEAEKYHVLPIDDRSVERMIAEVAGRPTLMAGRNAMTLTKDMKGMGVDVFPNLQNTSYTITADLELGPNGNGVIVCQGGRFGGLSLYVKNGKPAFTYNFLGLNSTTIASTQSLAPGKHTLVYDFKYDGGGPGRGGVGTISIDGQKVAEGRIERTQPGIFSVVDLADVGIDLGTAVADYGPSSKFNGNIKKVVVQRNAANPPSETPAVVD
ncbi:arylsulfatase [Mariniradius sediminis]|uniref:Arylsulfatase n=1 Tax=Mariniradius sediminis TaxID=2909237 RepID=A0ABS9BUV3_9BACT|nr:arylsulfatase [Mariniradius sediminis]MCF1751843.1 arylsulfatase [Mariniradius sediminis]